MRVPKRNVGPPFPQFTESRQKILSHVSHGVLIPAHEKKKKILAGWMKLVKLGARLVKVPKFLADIHRTTSATASSLSTHPTATVIGGSVTIVAVTG